MSDLPDLIPLDEALRRVLDGIQALPPVTVDLADAVGLALAEPVRSALTLPPWPNSAMDGFAVRAVDVAAATAERPVVLRVLGEVPAGRAPDDTVGPGTALRIMTGAMMPAGADTVVPVEDTDAPAGASEVPAAVAVRAPTRSGGNVRLPGSDVAAGTPLLERGRVLDPAAIALLAATGHASVVVHRRPRVAVISTGDELVPPGLPLGPAQIHECNSFTLAAQAAEAGAEVRRMGIAADTLPDLLALLREAVAWGDVVVLSGGVSVGAHDHVKAAFSGIGQLDVWRVAIKPGRPFAFGRAAVDGRPAYLFGLPGNPVSVFVTFELFVRPVLRRLAGQAGSIGRPERIVRVAERIRGSSGRQTIARVVLETDPDRPDGLLARPSGGQDSHMLFSLATANGLLFVPPDADLEAGDTAVAWELRGHEG
jgi:molybdenum cofactor synthesis domain-containing protein